ncbi:MAG: XrtA-associated tyrosine autokinase [Gammaproteobacteria bacterium]|nr:XrtA-associated tyrosine autokinase [Gammaproteobacteria bacterium]MDH3768598.1 XrtA-associated tyrosine autokinase [Gammaproteobacteria bacterium]
MSIVEKAVDKHRKLDKLTPIKDKRVINDARIGGGPHIPTGAGQVDIELNHEQLAKEGLTPYGETADKIVDEFRRIKRPLLSAAFEEHQEGAERENLVMIASALPAEGKTFTAMNLAMCIALERDRTVLLVDADVAKPHVSRILNVHNEPGLMDLLQDHTIDIGDVLLQTDMPSLKIIPAGQRHRHAAEMLSSQRMEAIAEELATRYSDRIILFDTSPILQTSEAQSLATLMGQLVLVVHAGQTPQRAVNRTLELLGDRKIDIVLNKCRAPASSPYYGGYYGQN